MLLACAATLALNSVPAHADGGNAGSVSSGGINYSGGAGGVDGPLSSATGSDAAGSNGGGYGGGGGVDLTTGNGAPGGAARLPTNPPAPFGTPGLTGTTGQFIAAPAQISTTVSGGAGNAGQAEVIGVNTAGGNGGGGVGISATSAITVTATGRVTGGAGFSTASVAARGGMGGGGVGIFSSANVTVDSGGQVTGGAGGSNTSGPNAAGGGGGAAAILLTGSGTVQNSGLLTGGAGGRSTQGSGGDAGAGIQLLAGGTVINLAGGTITGGAGGNGRFLTANALSPGDGGAGIKGTGISIINAGAISGGAGGTTTGWTPVAGQAIQFTGGVNALEIWSGSNIAGNVQAFSTADTFKLGGSTDAAFDLSQLGAAGKYQGFGQFVKTGASTWTLTGTTTDVTPWTLMQGSLRIASDAQLGDAAGGVTFNGGTLQNTAAFTTARALSLAGAGTVQTDADLTLSGIASGAGVLTKTGTGSLILTGANSYTGGTTISAGAVQIGNGGTTGSLTGNITNNASLAFNRSDAVTFGGVISGTGTVGQLGGGTTTLSGVNTYTGGTTITAGRLTGSATSFGSGAIIDNAALVIDQPAEASFANAINGTGSFTKQGAGRLNYTGTGTLSGATTVAAGLLSVNGSLANSAVTVQSGASLGGTGTVGATTVQSGGAIAPGNSIGTLQVNGAYIQAAGSTYQVEVDPNTNASDRIAVTGTATLQSGAGLNVTKSVAGDYHLGAVYTVLSATGGRTGTYSLSGDTAGASAFLGLRDSYDANNAYLTVVQTRDPADAAQTPNQQQVAENLPDPVLPPVLNLPSDAAARDAFDQLSAQALASAKGALVSNGLYVRDATLDRLRDVRCKPTENRNARNAACESDQPSLWAQGFGGWGGVSGNANASGLNRSTAGMLAGFDLPVMDWRLGMFGGFSNSDFRLTGGPASGQTTDYHLGAYGGTEWDGISLSLGVSYSWNTIRTDRTVAFGTFTDRLQALYNAGVTQVFADAGYGMDMFGLTLEPFANLAYLNLRTDGFTEVGGAAALTARADTIENAITTFGVRPSATVDLGDFPVTLRGMAGWRHTFGTVTPTSTGAFAGGNAFTISGAPIARDAMALEAGLDFALGDTISAGLTYGGQISSRTTDQTARGTIRIAF